MLKFQIFSSLPYLAILLADFANNCNFTLFASYGPTYLGNMLGVDIRLIGWFSAIPMLCRYFGGIIHSEIATLQEEDIKHILENNMHNVKLTSKNFNIKDIAKLYEVRAYI